MHPGQTAPATTTRTACTPPTRCTAPIFPQLAPAAPDVASVPAVDSCRGPPTLSGSRVAVRGERVLEDVVCAEPGVDERCGREAHGRHVDELRGVRGDAASVPVDRAVLGLEHADAEAVL